MPHKDTHRDAARQSGTYDVYLEIDIDCQELLDAIGLDYKESETDMSQNEVCLSLTPDEYKEVFNFSIADNYFTETAIGAALLNPELGEYVTKVTVYTPYADKITFE